MAGVRFEPLRRPLLCKRVAEELLRARSSGLERVEVSLDLGRRASEAVLKPEGVWVKGGLIPWEKVEEVARADEKDIYLVTREGVVEASIAGRHFYKLVLSEWGHAPTIEIDGIHMHRVKGVTPEVDAEMKVRLLGRLRCKKVLDTCMGLGYTAITALRRGACKVVTMEVDVNVLRLARLNPWSEGLDKERVELRVGDAYEMVAEYREEFDAAIHDPPRLPLAGELYGLEFYRRLAKALKPGGRVVHYVGQPGIIKGRKIWRGVMERMRAAGFQVSYDPKSRCVYGRRQS